MAPDIDQRLYHGVRPCGDTPKDHTSNYLAVFGPVFSLYAVHVFPASVRNLVPAPLCWPITPLLVLSMLPPRPLRLLKETLFPQKKANVVHGILYSSAALPYHNGLVEVTLVYQPNSATWFLGITPQAHAVGPSVGYLLKDRVFRRSG